MRRSFGTSAFRGRVLPEPILYGPALIDCSRHRRVAFTLSGGPVRYLASFGTKVTPPRSGAGCTTTGSGLRTSHGSLVKLRGRARCMLRAANCCQAERAGAALSHGKHRALRGRGRETLPGRVSPPGSSSDEQTRIRNKKGRRVVSRFNRGSKGAGRIHRCGGVSDQN